MHNQQHPDTEQLDRLRAGLLDDRPDEKAALEQHLAGCNSCSAHAGIWKQLDPGALGPQLDTGAIDSALQAARRQALADKAGRRPRSLVPYATAALLVLTVTVGLWTIQSGTDTTNMMAENSQTVPDIYEDLDFYLWLATQDDSKIDNGNT